jgi:hypothetical protein
MVMVATLPLLVGVAAFSKFTAGSGIEQAPICRACAHWLQCSTWLNSTSLLQVDLLPDIMA